MKKKIMSVMLVLGTLLGFGMAQTDTANANSQEDKEVITVGVSAQSKPYNYYDEANELTGFEIELFEA